MRAIDESKYQYKSEFARRYIGEGKVAMILKLLATRYGPISAAVEARIRSANSEEFDGIVERLLTAPTVEEAIGLPSLTKDP